MNGTRPNRLPDFLIIGAPKSATTWLARNLDAHPQLAVHPDEIHYFSRFYENWPLQRYQDMLRELGADKIGEKSNSYLTDTGSAQHIRATMPNVQLIAMLRDPIDRAYSSYCMQIDRGRAGADIRRYLHPSQSPLPHIVAHGNYFDQLKIYYDTFPAAQLHVCLYEDMRSAPAALYRGVTRFLEAPDYESPVLNQRFNEKGTHSLPAPLARLRWAFHHSPIAGSRFYDALRRTFSISAMKLLPSQVKTYPKMPDDVRAVLRDYYRDEVSKLEDLTGVTLSSVWR